MTGGGRYSRRHLFEVAAAGGLSLLGGWLASRRLAPGARPVAAPPADPMPVPPVPEAGEVPDADAVEEEPAAEPPRSYEPVDGEVFTGAKVVAARVVEALTTYEAGRAADAAARAATHAPDPGDAAVLEAAWPLLVDGAASRGEVVYPQLGGLDPHVEPQDCSVMVVLRQELTRDGRTRAVTRCVDVRLRRVGDDWRLDRVADASGQPVSRPPVLSDAAERILDHGAVDMPDSARWDIYEGIVDDRVLEELLVLAADTSLAVTSFRRGHPEHVFGTDRRSAHMAGLAVDVWGIGGEPVVVQQPQRDDDAYDAAVEVFEGERSSNFGSPWAFDGFGGRSFHDPVHLDHFHLGFAASAAAEEDDEEAGAA